MQSIPFFTTRTKYDAQRLLTIVARGNGGAPAFEVKPIAGTRPAYAIHFVPSVLGFAFPSIINDVEVNRKCAEMATFLKGYLACEAQTKRTSRYISRLRAEHRKG